MKLNNLSFIALISLLIFGCNDIKKRNNEINKITLLTGLCFGECPVQSIEIDSSLTLKYHGIENADRQGYYIGKITHQDWDSINLKFEKIGYKELDSVYEHSVDDPPTYLEIRYNNKIKKVRAQSASLPDEVEKTYYWLFELCKKINLEKTNDSLIFEKENLHLMYPPPPPPLPNIN